MAYVTKATPSGGRNGRAVLDGGALALALQALIEDAHTICSYSKATKGNVPVKLTAV
ncbi:MAG: hypothetical protein ABI146_09725 [Nitrobacter sp.]|jgi:hypothetical protein